ncbi:MAG TPA: hypothetical protein VF593_01845 [Chthoniobacteraceae bacterium]|jgi:hypothetical protein
MQPRASRVVVRSTRGRDALLVVAGLLAVACVIWAISSMSKPYRSPNILRGTVVAKQFIPGKEEQVSFNGRALAGARQSEGEYLLKVKVEAENRTFEVPVSKSAYERKKIGDSLEFVRPPSEHR